MRVDASEKKVAMCETAPTIIDMVKYLYDKPIQDLGTSIEALDKSV